MRSTIRFQFYLFIVILLSIIMVSVNILPITSSRDAIFDAKKNSMTTQGSSAAQALSRLEILSPESVAEVLRIINLTNFTRICITGPDGQTIYDSLGSTEEPLPSDDIALCLSGKTVFRSLFQNGCFDSFCYSPIVTGTKVNGAVCIRDMDTERAQLVLSLQNRVLTITLFICLGSIILALLFSSSVLSRFSRLVSSIRTVADGDYAHRVEMPGKDELSDLGKEFNLLTEKLQITEEQRRRFVSDASHELKTPLASIRLLSDSIVQSEQMDLETLRDFVSDIGNEAERLQHTTEKLLDLSRLDDDVRIAPVPVDLKQVIIDAFVFVKPLATERSVRIRCDLEDGCIVMSNSDDMLRVVFNLMENAVKYNVEGGSVKVCLKADGENIVFSVRDTGIGIPEEDRLNVFSRFYRVDKARSREAGGSGLGLSIVHDTVLLYNGTITIGENTPCGTVFTVTFPRALEEETGI